MRAGADPDPNLTPKLVGGELYCLDPPSVMQDVLIEPWTLPYTEQKYQFIICQRTWNTKRYRPGLRGPTSTLPTSGAMSACSAGLTATSVYYATQKASMTSVGVTGTGIAC